MIIGLIVFAIYLYFFIGIHQIFSVLEHVNSVQYAFFYSLALIRSIILSVFLVSSLEQHPEKLFQSKFPIDGLTCIIGSATLQI